MTQQNIPQHHYRRQLDLRVFTGCFVALVVGPCPGGSGGGRHGLCPQPPIDPHLSGYQQIFIDRVRSPKGSDYADILTSEHIGRTYPESDVARVNLPATLAH